MAVYPSPGALVVAVVFTSGEKSLVLQTEVWRKNTTSPRKTLMKSKLEKRIQTTMQEIFASQFIKAMSTLIRDNSSHRKPINCSPRKQHSVKQQHLHYITNASFFNLTPL